jgi:RNA polymerase sigma factor (sigma-70 family)
MKGALLHSQRRQARFEALVMPHLPAAYDLARWLVGGSPEAQDVVQEACVRALRGFEGLRGDDARPWLLAIVRNCALRHIARRQRAANVIAFDEALHGHAEAASQPGPERQAEARAAGRALHDALDELPPAFREAVVLRELHGLSYREIAQVQDVPAGTVMSRLARGRALLRAALQRRHGVRRRDDL